MNIFKRYSILGLLMMVLVSCSHPSTDGEMSVSSKDLHADEMGVEGASFDAGLDAHSVENIIYRKTKRRVEIYNLDVSEDVAVGNFSFSRGSEVGRSLAGAVRMSGGVEIYPIDVSMQKTLKPIQ